MKEMSSIKKLMLLCMAVPVILVMAACASPSSAKPHETPSPVKTTSLSTTFGNTVKYTDGLSVTMSIPEKFIPSSTATEPDSPSQTAVKFTVTVTYNGHEDDVLLSSDPEVESDNTPAQYINDIASPDSIGYTNDSGIEPGQTTSWVVGFYVTNPSDIVATYHPNPFYNDSTFTLAK